MTLTAWRQKSQCFNRLSNLHSIQSLLCLNPWFTSKQRGGMQQMSHWQNRQSKSHTDYNERILDHRFRFRLYYKVFLLIQEELSSWSCRQAGTCTTQPPLPTKKISKNQYIPILMTSEVNDNPWRAPKAVTIQIQHLHKASTRRKGGSWATAGPGEWSLGKKRGEGR